MDDLLKFISSNPENIAYISVTIGAFIQLSQKSFANFYKYIKKRKNNKKFIRANEVNQKINKRLIGLLAKIENISPMRVLILRLHNGEYFVGNNEQSIMKVSCTHEEAVAGKTETSEDYQNIHTSHLPILLNDLVNKGKHIIINKDYEKWKTDEFIKAKHLKHGVTSSISVTIEDSANHLIGFLNVDIDDDIKEAEIMKYIDLILKETKDIEYLLKSI